METYIHELKIPKERIPILIGPKGKTKKTIEKETKTQITIDSKEGDVTIQAEDGIHIYIAKEITKAIGRGFNPETALKLTKQQYTFDLINLTDYTKSKNQITRIKSRIIGTEGKARKTLETLTETSISIFGKTIAIIGEAEEVTTTRRAIESLIGGSTHSTIYKWLEKQKRETKNKKILGNNQE